MAEKVEELTFRIKATDEASATFQKVGKAAEAAAKGSVLESLNKTVGEESGLKKTLDLLAGAGAIAGITLVAQQVTAAATAAAKLRAEFAAGKISATELTDGLLKGLPIIGQGYTAARAIRELLTGAEAAYEKQAAQEERINGLYVARKAVLTAIRKENEEAFERARRIMQDVAIAGLPAAMQPAAAARAAAANALRDFDKAAADKRFERNKELDASGIAEARGALQDALREQSRIAATGGAAVTPGSAAAENFKNTPEGRRNVAAAAAAVKAAEDLVTNAGATRQKALRELDDATAKERRAIEAKNADAVKAADEALSEERVKLAKETSGRIADIEFKTENERLTMLGQLRLVKLREMFKAEGEAREAAARAAAARIASGDVFGGAFGLAQEGNAILAKREQEMRSAVADQLKGLAGRLFSGDARSGLAGGVGGLADAFKRMFFGGTGPNGKDIPIPAAAISGYAGAGATSFAGTGVGLAMAEANRARQDPVVKLIEVVKKQGEDQKKRDETNAGLLDDLLGIFKKLTRK